MRIPDYILDGLFSWPGLGFNEYTIYMLVRYHRPASIDDLVTKSSLGRHRVVRACRILAKAGWLNLIKQGRTIRPVGAVPAVLQEKMIAELKTRLSMAQFKGEFLLKSALDLWVDSDNFVDNARPPFLVNPLTDEPLEIDRYYPEDRVGIEYNGAQHYRMTEIHADEKAFRTAQSHDLMKLALCVKNGVTLVIVTNTDLSLKGIRRLLPPKLRLNAVNLDEPYARALEDLLSSYRRKAARKAKSDCVRPAEMMAGNGTQLSQE